MAVYRRTNFSDGISPFAEVGESIADAEGAFFQNQPPYASGHVTNATIPLEQNNGVMFWMTAAQSSYVYGYHYALDGANVMQFIGTDSSTVAVGASFVPDPALIGEGGLAEYKGRMYFSDPGGNSLRFWDFASTTTLQASSGSGLYGPLYKHRGRLFIGKHGFDTSGGETLAHVDVLEGEALLEEAIAFDLGEKVNTISSLNEYIVLGLSSKRIVVWDTFTLSPDYIFNLADEPRAMYNLDNELFIWAPPHLYSMKSFGSQPEKVMTIPARFRGGNQIGRIDAVPGGLTAWNGLLYMTTFRRFAEEGTKYGLWAYGNVHAAGPNALSFIKTMGPTGPFFREQGGHALATNGDVLFVANQEGAFDLSVYTYHPGNDYGDFSVELTPEDFGMPETEKQTLRVAVTTLPLPSGASVGVEVRENYGATAFTPVEMNVVDEIYRYGTLKNAPYARKFEFKITANASGASSPTITGFMAHVEASVPSEFGQ